MLNTSSHQETKNKTTMRYHITFVRMVIIKKIRNAGEGVEKGEICALFNGNVNWCSHYEKQYGGSSKPKNELPYDLAIPVLGI